MTIGNRSLKELIRIVTCAFFLILARWNEEAVFLEHRLLSLSASLHLARSSLTQFLETSDSSFVTWALCY